MPPRHPKAVATTKVDLRPYGLTTWRAWKGSHVVGSVKKVKVSNTYHYQCYNVRNQKIGTAQFTLLKAKGLFKNA